uniref:TnpV protein n=1 Tax=Enterocloster clostridioformis TaxID=1531 RepID=UPI0026F0BCEC|nr:TnpV protein [Enterocloster clostridioformis]
MFDKLLLKEVSSRHLYRYVPVRQVERYLTKIDQQAEEMFFQLVMQMAEQESITAQLKADSQVEWIGRMNNIRQRAEEIVNAELIYS